MPRSKPPGQQLLSLNIYFSPLTEEQRHQVSHHPPSLAGRQRILRGERLSQRQAAGLHYRCRCCCAPHPDGSKGIWRVRRYRRVHVSSVSLTRGSTIPGPLSCTPITVLKSSSLGLTVCSTQTKSTSSGTRNPCSLLTCLISPRSRRSITSRPASNISNAWRH